MKLNVIERTAQPPVETKQASIKKQAPIGYPDPLDEDSPADESVLTTKRGLIRLALVAAETGARFHREGIGYDPVAWMLTPRTLFGGRAAVEACLDRDECMRAILLHGLSIGMDADPEELDRLAADDTEGEGFFDADFDDDDDLDGVVPDQAQGAAPRLWTSLIVDETAGGMTHAFDAVIAGSRAEAEMRLRARHGAKLADAMEIVEGFDAGVPLVEALVSPAVADMLSLVAGDPGSPLARGLSVSVEQRFAA
ncbi:hypothetical protein [Sphingomonas sp. PB4P5]|uniref:hypothetical protein n=1 Tax=Parasphingomonas puruogangriensis TaxID=3096155 RepID=UPI002FCB46BD